MRQTIGLMAACAALLAGCTNEVGEGLGLDTPIQVTASVEGALTTRTDNSTESLSTFGLSIKDGTGYTGNYAGENILAEKDNGTWTLSKTVLYQGNGQSYYAYAPYVKGHTGESLTFTVDADQAANDLQGSDLLYAAGNVDDPTLAITFNHKLSKLTVTLQKGENLTENVTFNAVTLRGTKLGTTLALVDDENGVKAGDLGQAEGTATDITMCPATTANTYECILVPQEATYSVLINAMVGNEAKTYVYTPSAPQEFLENKSYTLTLTVKNADVSMGNIGVNDWDGDDIPLTAGEAIEPYTIEADGSYTVYTAEGLQAWRKAINSENTINCTLAADIDMTGQTLPRMDVRNFGVFDGNGHTITGLKDCLVHWNEGGTIRNLTLVEPTITTNRTGAVAGTNYGTIENCHVVGGSVVSQGSWCGGIVGANDGTIRACSSSTAVTAYLFEAGGIAGISTGTILACYATGSVTASGGYIGAIAGEHHNDYGGTITACYWSGNVAQGVGNALTEGATKVEGSVTWETAMNTMNTALDGSGYRWIENTGENKATHPLVIATE